jgi:outer membrane protein assembly factor BamB
MKGYAAWVGGLVLGLGLLSMARPAFAVISRLIPLREVLASEQLIFTATVVKLDADNPAMVLRVADDLKGKAPFRNLSVSLIADREGQREGHTPKLLKRLAPGLTVIVFISKRDKRFTAFAYSNGTWFQLIGQTGEDPAAIRWSFTHCEPYLRRTFKGTTADLRQVIVNALANKKHPPEPDPKEPPGLGPEIESEKKGRAPQDGRSPLFAVIPTFVIVGPLALLAMLFPAIFGGLALLLRRWLVLFSIASLNSTLYLGHSWLHGTIKDRWWGKPAALWYTMVLVSLAGICWSWRRQRALRASNPAAAAVGPRRGECMILWSVSLIGLAIVAWCVRQGTLLNPPWKELLVIWGVAWVGTLYTAGLGFGKKGQSAALALPSTEAVMLWTLTFACAGIAATSLAPPAQSDGIKVVWTFEPKGRSAMISSPALSEDRLYVAAIQGSGFSTCGVVYCLNRENGEEVWRFDDDGAMQQVFSSPCLAAGRLYIGEGLHENRGSKFYCLDAASGRKLWHFETASHTESSPCVANGKVYFGAGEDGIYCLDATTGAERWHFHEDLHVDASPKVLGKYLYAGSGVSRTQKQTQVFCLDADSGLVLWRQRVQLPVWGSPCVCAGRVFFGLGNGRYDQSAEHPAGALLCVDARTGTEIWRYDVDDAVLMSPVADGAFVYFGSRDHHGYCLSQDRGRLQWKVDLGSPVVARSIVEDNHVYMVGSAGKVCGVDIYSGEPVWTFDVAEVAQSRATLFASPASILEERKRRLYVGASLESAFGSQAVLYCLEESKITIARR